MCSHFSLFNNDVLPWTPTIYLLVHNYSLLQFNIWGNKKWRNLRRLGFAINTNNVSIFDVSIFAVNTNFFVEHMYSYFLLFVKQCFAMDTNNFIVGSNH